MDKRIASLTIDPYTVNLADRKCSLFIDPKSGSIFVDEGEGDDRMNGAVFSPANHPVFSVKACEASNHLLVLDYRGIQCVVGTSQDREGLRQWAESANALLVARTQQGGAGGNGVAAGQGALPPSTATGIANRELSKRPNITQPIHAMIVHVSGQICSHAARTGKSIPETADGSSWIAAAVSTWLQQYAGTAGGIKRKCGRHRKRIRLDFPDHLWLHLETECERRRCHPEPRYRVLRHIVESAILAYDSAR
jgi:hypothetical protein